MCLFLTDWYASAPGSFMYSLRNNDGLAQFKSSLRYESPSCAIRRYRNFGPTFGCCDLYIADNAGSNTNSFTNFGNTYNLPPGYTYRGRSYFTPSEVEVLYLN